MKNNIGEIGSIFIVRVNIIVLLRFRFRGFFNIVIVSTELIDLTNDDPQIEIVDLSVNDSRLEVINALV